MHKYLVVLRNNLVLKTGIFVASSPDNLLSSVDFIGFLVKEGRLDPGKESALYANDYIVFDIDNQSLVESKTQVYRSKVSWECLNG